MCSFDYSQFLGVIRISLIVEENTQKLVDFLVMASRKGLESIKCTRTLRPYNLTKTPGASKEDGLLSHIKATQVHVRRAVDKHE